MIIELPDPNQVVLQVAAQNPDGSPKTSLSTANVRVYYVNVSGVDVNVLSSTPLTQVGSSNIWRFRWVPVSLPEGHYFAEYSLTDTLGATFVDVEDIVVQDFAVQTDLEFLKNIESGKWEILNDQMIFYNLSGVEILRFNLFDINGVPTNGINMYKREPV